MSTNNDNSDSASDVDDGIGAALPPLPGSESINTKNKKLLGVAYGFGMNVNTIIGSGIVTTPGIIWKSVKSPKIVILLWLIGGIVSMSGSLSYVELGVIHKISGGETRYLQTAYPNPKFMMSYLFSFMFIFAIRPGILSAVLQSAAQYFWYTIKGRGYNDDVESYGIGWHISFAPFWFTKIMAVTFLLIITVYHMLSNRWANYINQTLAVIKLITYSIIAIAGIYKLIANWETSRINWQQPLSGSADVAAYSTSILLILFSYNGWNNLNYSLDEFRKPEKKLIFSNSLSVGIVTLVYLLVNTAYISVVPQTEVTKNTSYDDETIAATFFGVLFNSSGVARIFTGLVVLSVIGTAASNVWGGSRVIVAAAKSDFFPKYSNELSTWNSRFNTPVNALLMQFIWCSLIIFFVGGSFPITSFKLFSTFAIYSHWIFYLATGIGLLVIRYRNENMSGSNLFKVPIPIAGIFISAGLFILTFSFVVNDECAEKAYPCNTRIKNQVPFLISYAFLFIALILYYWWKRILFG